MNKAAHLYSPMKLINKVDADLWRREPEAHNHEAGGCRLADGEPCTIFIRILVQKRCAIIVAHVQAEFRAAAAAKRGHDHAVLSSKRAVQCIL